MKQCTSTKTKKKPIVAEKNAVGSTKKQIVAASSTKKPPTESEEGGEGEEGDGEGEEEGDDEDDDGDEEEGPPPRCCVCTRANSLCQDNSCDTCNKPVCYKSGQSDSCSQRRNVGQKEGGLVVRCVTCVLAEKKEEVVELCSEISFPPEKPSSHDALVSSRMHSRNRRTSGACCRLIPLPGRSGEAIRAFREGREERERQVGAPSAEVARGLFGFFFPKPFFCRQRKERQAGKRSEQQ